MSAIEFEDFEYYEEYHYGEDLPAYEPQLTPEPVSIEDEVIPDYDDQYNDFNFSWAQITASHDVATINANSVEPSV